MLVNVDCSVKNNVHVACGGIIRDDSGEFLGAFMSNMGSTTITTELMGVYQGLLLASMVFQW